MTIEITIDGIEELLYRYGRAEGLEMLRRPIYQSLALAVDALATYPPPPAPGEWARRTTAAQKRAFFARVRHSAFRGRTGTLGRSWNIAVPRVRHTSSGIEGQIGNPIEYGHWVQDERDQASFHRGRWPTDEDVLGNLEDDIRRRFEITVADALG